MLGRLLVGMLLLGSLLGMSAWDGLRASASTASDGEPGAPAGLSAAEWQRIQRQLPGPVQEIKLTASDAEADDLFGGSVAISGDTVVVGAETEDGGSTDPNFNAGAAYVFERNAGGPNAWGEVAKLTASDAEANDWFGEAVAISGDTVVVGAEFEDGGRGAAYVFERDRGGTDNWGEVQKLVAGVRKVDARFGFDVAISGDTVVVGAYGDDGGTGAPIVDAGAAYLFERNQGGTNAWGQVKKLTASNAQDGDGFGVKVTIDGDLVVVGASEEDGGPGNPLPDTGAAYVFERNNGGANTWGEVARLSASDAEVNDGFGWRVALSGDTLVVGAMWEDGSSSDPDANSGAAYVFERNNGGANAWGEVTKLTASDAQADDEFGNFVAISGDTVVVGARSEDGGPGDPTPDAGAAYVFEREAGGNNAWDEVAKLTASDAEAGDVFGISVAISAGGQLVVGAYLNNGDPTNPILDSGAAYLLCVDDHLEENDDFGAASSAMVGMVHDLQICGADDDYYAVNLTSGETLELTTGFSHAAGDLDIALYDPAQSLVTYSISITNVEAITHTATTSGAHYLHVYGYRNAVNRYDLCVDDSLEPNDNFGTAHAISGGANAIAGLQLCHGDSDMYAIDLTSGDAIEIDALFTHAAGDLDMVLIDPSRLVVAKSITRTDNEQIDYTAETTGTHFLLIFGWNRSVANGYELQLVPTATPPGGGLLYLPLLTRNAGS